MTNSDSEENSVSHPIATTTEIPLSSSPLHPSFAATSVGSVPFSIFPPSPLPPFSAPMASWPPTQPTVPGPVFQTSPFAAGSSSSQPQPSASGFPFGHITSVPINSAVGLIPESPVPGFGGGFSPFANIWTLNVTNHVTTRLATVDDYLGWRTQFDAFLTMHQLQGIVDGRFQPPPSYILDSAGCQQTNPSYVQWLRLDQCVRSWLFATISKDLLSEVHDLHRSSHIWRQLATRFNNAIFGRAMELQRSLTDLKKPENQTMEDYLLSIKVIADSLAAINTPVSENELIRFTINGLSYDYEPAVTAITYSTGPVTFDDLKIKLIMYEQSLKTLGERDGHISQHQAFATGNSSGGGGSNNQQSQQNNRGQQPHNNPNRRSGQGGRWNNSARWGGRGSWGNYSGRGGAFANQQQMHRTPTGASYGNTSSDGLFGPSPNSVARASERIQEAVESSALGYSHFISLPLAIHPQLVDKLISFQNSILGIHYPNPDEVLESSSYKDTTDEEDGDQKLDEAPQVAVTFKAQEDGGNVKVDVTNIPFVSYPPKSSATSTSKPKTSTVSELGIDKSIFINPKTFHLTVLMLKLWSKERVDAAVRIFEGIAAEVMDALDGQPVCIRLKGLDCMKGSFANARVLYAPVEVVGGEDRLLQACKVITYAFIKGGLVLEKDVKRALKLHATVMNASHRKSFYNPWKKTTRNSNSFDARGVMEQYGSEEWGEYLIREVHLSQRFVFDEDGYYHCCASIPLPENVQVD